MFRSHVRRLSATPAPFSTPKNSVVRAKATPSGSAVRRKVATPSVIPKRKGGGAVSTANLTDESDVNEDENDFESPPKPGKTYNHFQTNHHQTHHQTHHHQQQQHLGLGSTSSSQIPRGFGPSTDASLGFSFAPTNQSLSSSLYHSPNLSHSSNGASLVSPSFSAIANASALGTQPTTSRMSKEKQQFFRHSAFNSDRPNKVSPPAATNTRLGHQQHLDITHTTSSDSDKSADPKAVTKNNAKTTGHRSADLPGRVCATNLSETSSSCSSSEDDDDDDSSSGTSSTSSSTNSTSSSSNSSSNSTDSEESGKSTTTAKSKKPPTPSPAPAGEWSSVQATGNSHRKAATNSRSSSSMSMQSGAVHFPTSTPTVGGSSADSAATASAWGFAAEAKKCVDIFRKTAEVSNERVFGNFDGVDKDSLVVKTTTGGSSLSSSGLNNNNKTTGQLKGLFDSLSHVFSTTDYTRSRSNAPSTYKSVDRRRKNKDAPAPKEVLKETRSTFKDFKEQQRQMSTMGQKIGVPSPDFSSFQPPKQNLLSNRFPVGKSFFGNQCTSSAPLSAFSSGYAQQMSVTSAQNFQSNSAFKRRVLANKLPLEPPPRRRYDSSSEDEVQHIFSKHIPPRLTPSNLVKNAINCQSQQGRQQIRSQLFNGATSAQNSVSAAASRPGSPSHSGTVQTNHSGNGGAAVYPKPSSSYSQSQLMGKNALPKQPIK